MKKRLSIFALIFGIPLISMAVPAEQGEGADWDRGMKIERLTKELNLTDEQKTRLEAIFKDQRAKHKALREEGRARMKEVLNEEQMTKVDQMRERGHECWKERKPSPKE